MANPTDLTDIFAALEDARRALNKAEKYIDYVASGISPYTLNNFVSDMQTALQNAATEVDAAADALDGFEPEEGEDPGNGGDGGGGSGGGGD